MVTVLGVLGVLAVLFVVGVVAVREEDALVAAPRDHADPALPSEGPVQAADLEQVRFGMALRGYRMSEVDGVLDRLGSELGEREVRLAELAAELDRLRGPRAVSGAPGSDNQSPVEADHVPVEADGGLVARADVERADVERAAHHRPQQPPEPTRR